jgi:hypothetical protein
VIAQAPEGLGDVFRAKIGNIAADYDHRPRRQEP